MLRFALVIGVLLVAGAPASARQVQVLDFAFPASVTGPKPSGAAADRSIADIDDALALRFVELGAQRKPESLSPLAPSPLVVPAWMRSGLRPSFHASGAAPTPFASGDPPIACTGARYRPRGDLSAATEMRRARLFPSVASIACQIGIPVGLFDALVIQESRYQLGAISPKGAIGPAQLMPGTAAALGVDATDPIANLFGGARYLRQQLEEFGRTDLALAAYNAGPGSVRRYRSVPPFAETRAYVSATIRGWLRASTPVVATGLHESIEWSANPVRGAQVMAYTLPRSPNPR